MHLILNFQPFHDDVILPLKNILAKNSFLQGLKLAPCKWLGLNNVSWFSQVASNYYLTLCPNFITSGL